MKSLFTYLIFFYLISLTDIALAKKIPCKAQAEKIAMQETKKKGNFTGAMNSPVHPTELDGKSVVVYIGARAHYNYFKMRFDKKCKLIKIEDSEFAD